MEARTTGLNRVDLSLRPHQALEALRQLGAVEECALSSFNGAEGAAGRRTDGAGGEVGLLVQRAVLLRFLAVAGEGLGEVVRGRGRVRVGSVVDLCRESALRAIGHGKHGLRTGRRCALAQEADHGLAALLEEHLGGMHRDGWQRFRSCRPVVSRRAGRRGRKLSR